MTELLIVAATDFELEAFQPRRREGTVRKSVSGVGTPETFIRLLTSLLAEGYRPDSILNIGIAGAYPGTGVSIGDIVIADGETWGDVGFSLPEPPNFRSITDSPFGAWYGEPLPTVRPAEWALSLPPTGTSFGIFTGTGCTVNTCTGTDTEGERRRAQTGAIFESMEGAAVAAVGRALCVPVCEIRAISNIAGHRDMRPENIRRALENLRRYLNACPAVDMPAGGDQ